MQFDKNDLIKKYINKDLFDIIYELSSEIERLDKLHLNINHKSNRHLSAYQLREYREYAGDFLFFLNSGITPAGIGIDGLKFFLPIINNLVDKGQLKQSVLDRFQ
jgi:hypothetical protein